MKLPADVHQLLKRHFDNRHQDWLCGGGWPLDIALGVPSESSALGQLDATRAWVDSWLSWQGAGTVQWTERRWRTLGTQRLPELLRLAGPEQVAAWLDFGERWERAARRHAQLTARWPSLSGRLGKLFGVLADYPETEFQRLTAALAWLAANPGSGIYPRQLPIPGLDTKWVESRKSLLADLLCGVNGRSSQDGDFYTLCGLRRPSALVRVRILDPLLRSRTGGLKDFAAPVEDLARLDLSPESVLIVENMQTGLALGEYPGTVAFLALGYGVDVLAHLAWVRNSACLYWGDIDTHGYAILDRARSVLPSLRSVLMDAHTLRTHEDLWTHEPKQHGAPELPHLTSDEKAVYRELKNHVWGQAIRLEQERISWSIAAAALDRLLAGRPA